MTAGKVVGWLGVVVGVLFGIVSSSVVSSANPDCDRCSTRIWIAVAVAAVTAGLLLLTNRWERRAALLLIGVGSAGLAVLLGVQGGLSALGALLTASSGLLILRRERHA